MTLFTRDGASTARPSVHPVALEKRGSHSSVKSRWRLMVHRVGGLLNDPGDSVRVRFSHSENKMGRTTFSPTL